MQQFEKQKQELQAEARALKDQLVILREKTALLQQEYQTLQQKQRSLEETEEQLKSLIEKLEIQLNEEEKAKIREQEASLHWQGQSKEIQKALELKSALFIDSQTETKLLARQLSDTQKALDEAIAQNKILQNDKWLLAQEKAALEGQTRQMQKMIKVSNQGTSLA